MGVFYIQMNDDAELMQCRYEWKADVELEYHTRM